MWVVKLGGSLMKSGQLQEWLACLRAYHQRQIIVVPGGGIFADQIRTAQKKWQFGDVPAHKMAILAMEQYGLLLSGLLAEALVVKSEKDLANTQLRNIKIWLPAQMLLDNDDIQASWDVSSDSLALWLARQLKATHLVLVKPDVRPDIVDLVDPTFPKWQKNYEGQTYLLDVNQIDKFHDLLKSKA